MVASALMLLVVLMIVLMMCTFTVVTPCDPRDSCFGNHDFFCNERKDGIYDGEEEGEQRVEEEIKKNHEETKGFRSGKRSGVQTRVVQRTKDEAADNVVIIATGSGAKFSAFQPVRHFNLKNGETNQNEEVRQRLVNKFAVTSGSGCTTSRNCFQSLNSTISDASELKLAGTKEAEEKEEGKSGEKKTKEELEEERKKMLKEERKLKLKEAKRLRKIIIDRDEEQRKKLQENYPPKKKKRHKKFLQKNYTTSADTDSLSLTKKSSTGNNNDASSKIVHQIHTFTITSNDMTLFRDVLKYASAENLFDEDNDDPSDLDATAGDGNEITGSALLEMLADVAAVSWMFFFSLFP